MKEQKPTMPTSVRSKLTRLKRIANRCEVEWEKWIADDNQFPPPEFLNAVEELIEEAKKRHD